MGLRGLTLGLSTAPEPPIMRTAARQRRRWLGPAGAGIANHRGGRSRAGRGNTPAVRPRELPIIGGRSRARRENNPGRVTARLPGRGMGPAVREAGMPQDDRPAVERRKYPGPARATSTIAIARGQTRKLPGGAPAPQWPFAGGNDESADAHVTVVNRAAAPSFSRPLAHRPPKRTDSSASTGPRGLSLSVGSGPGADVAPALVRVGRCGASAGPGRDDARALGSRGGLALRAGARRGSGRQRWRLAKSMARGRSTRS